ncbi:AzlD family protein [Futiania mangrovi]|uniref:AzlD domain-containing protein n=1 Tax=Futiania mangrovi TaxID=2959716 RepID=A0A9J6PF23_9PROT|nr:AzlD domain-containing protein [Futiania mangrovii]MCP1337305.1 AzlD domain-containing protein [Futiania mangrovii]
MSVDPQTLLVIAMMAVVSYVTRAAGYFLLGFFTLTDPVRRGLEALPGAVLVSILAPMALRDGIAGLTIVLAVAFTLLTRREWLSVPLAVAAAASTRALIG